MLGVRTHDPRGRIGDYMPEHSSWREATVRIKLQPARYTNEQSNLCTWVGLSARTDNENMRRLQRVCACFQRYMMMEIYHRPGVRLRASCPRGKGGVLPKTLKFGSEHHRLEDCGPCNGRQVGVTPTSLFRLVSFSPQQCR